MRILLMRQVGQNRASILHQAERFVQFTKRKQTSVTCDLRSSEFELEFAVELNTKCLISLVAHWVLLSKWPKTLNHRGNMHYSCQHECTI